jgi:hypothetical protein
VPSYEIRAGKVRALFPYFVSDPVHRLLETAQERISRDAIPVIGEKFSMAVDDRRSILLVLSKMLRKAVDARHGGAFIFLPSSPSAENDFGLKIPYSTEALDLGDDIVKQWHAFADVVSDHAKEGYEQAIRKAEVLRSKTLTDSDAVGNFSAVDGCVVLTHDFRVLGFGAKIMVSSDEAERSRRRFKHIASNTVYEDATLMRAIGGTRHQSVARLCQAHPGVLVYTASQDGELKLFYSDDDFAYVYGPLDLPTVENEVYTL